MKILVKTSYVQTRTSFNEELDQVQVAAGGSRMLKKVGKKLGKKSVKTRYAQL